MAAIQMPAFLWGPQGQAMSPEQVAAQRRVAEALAAQEAPKDFASGMTRVGEALLHNSIQGRTAAAEEAGLASADAAFAGIGPESSFEDIMAASSNEWASDPQQRVAQALLNRQFESQDPMRQMELEMAQLELERMRNPQPEPGFEVLSPEDATSMGLPPGAYQRGPDGRIDPIGSGGGVTVNLGENGIDYGDPGAGLAWARNPDGTVKMDERGAPIALPFQGGKPYADMLAGQEAEAAADQYQGTQADIVTTDIDRALDQIEGNPLLTTGMGAQLTSWAGGSPAANVEGLLNTVSGNIGFDKLQAMRETSPTGAALGNVTEKELTLLQSTLGSLSQKQGDGQLADNLKRVKNVYLDIIHGPGQGPVREQLSYESEGQQRGAGGAARPTTEAEYNALPSGSQFIDPDDGQLYVKP